MKSPRRFAVEAASRYSLGIAALFIMGLGGCVTYDRSGHALIDHWNRQFGVEGRVP